MGLIANQMLLELLIKIRDKIAGAHQPTEKGENYAKSSSHREEHKGNEN